MLLVVLNGELAYTVLWLRVVELVVGPIVAARVSIVLVEEGHDIDNSLWVLLLLLLRYAIGLQCPLPFLRETLQYQVSEHSGAGYECVVSDGTHRELARFLIVANMCYMHRILRR